jgi:hypothetical protein
MISPRKWAARFVATREAQRTSTVNAQTRADEVRTILRCGTAEERQNYLDASRAWREAGKPDVPLITLWFTSRIFKEV